MYIKLLGILKRCCRLLEMESAYSFLHYSSTHSSSFPSSQVGWPLEVFSLLSLVMATNCHLRHPPLSPESKSLAEFSCFSEHLAADWGFPSLPHQTTGLQKINSLSVPELFSSFFPSITRYYVCTKTRLLTNFWTSSHFISVKSS